MQRLYKNQIIKTMIEELKNKRIAGIDYGKKRIGLAYTDELHISINPKITIENNADKWANIEKFFKEERIAAIVVGMPYTKDGTITKWLEDIRSFIAELKDKYNMPVFEQDEFASSEKAVEIMIASGMKKQKRAQKGSKDKLAAGVILNNFISDNL